MAELIGPGEAARRLGVSTRTVQRWLRQGRLRAVQVGGRLKVDAEGLGTPRARAPVQPRVSIRRLLVANRGELVPRIAATCRRLGIRCLALVSEDERAAWWATQADEVVPLRTSYLDPEAILAVALETRADAVHPGYGFLAESADFAAAVVAAGLVWVGPPPAAMRALGDKASARRLAARLGVPVLPGYEGAGQSDAALTREAARIGYPVILKPSGGGGGKGMHIVRDRAELPDALARARREAVAAFGDGRLVLERYLARPRHVEVQLLFDSTGHGVHLGERDCSLQRRHQKVVEESPSPRVDEALRTRLADAALRLAQDAGYTGAGTVEFLLDETGAFYFLELNARLQVEHPVTELVTGRDLVADQLRVACGEPLGLTQGEVGLTGHAIEARLYAEDPWAGFLPATGMLLQVRWPRGAGVRVDAGVGVGDRVGTRYDPLLAKIVALGRDRGEALERLGQALDTTAVLGVTTNRGFLRWLLRLPEVVEGDARTDTIAIRWHPDPAPVPDAAWRPGAAAIVRTLDSTGSAVAGSGSSSRLAGFRLNAPPLLRVRAGGEDRTVAVEPSAADGVAWVALSPDAGTPSAEPDAAGPSVVLDVDGRSIEVSLSPPPAVDAALHERDEGTGSATAVVAPMPGTVMAVRVTPGQPVEAREVLVVLEAMKMENAVTAPADGRVERVLVAPGQSVQRGEPLIELG